MIQDRPDATAQAALDAYARRPVSFAFLDIKGEPLRVTNAPYDFTFSGTGDEDLDGFTFKALDPQLVSIGPVRAKEGGSDTLTLRLSGLPGVDDELMTALGNRAAYVGRDCRLWRGMLHPDNLALLGGVWSYFTGYMSVPRIVGDRQSQTIELDVETYLAELASATPNRATRKG
ncbi:hypothetical protein [Sphingomonas sp. 2378]|uniref:hypothetical protein n=1 Tax=Sphingomonas sp. 2378 TaxID=1219748 RepID=UPI00311AD9B3